MHRYPERSNQHLILLLRWDFRLNAVQMFGGANWKWDILWTPRMINTNSTSLSFVKLKVRRMIRNWSFISSDGTSNGMKKYLRWITRRFKREEHRPKDTSRQAVRNKYRRSKSFVIVRRFQNSLKSLCAKSRIRRFIYVTSQLASRSQILKTSRNC